MGLVNQNSYPGASPCTKNGDLCVVSHVSIMGIMTYNGKIVGYDMKLNLARHPVVVG
jgi:hypothetical protein